MVNAYNIVAENVGITLACIFLFLMLYTKPRKTVIYIINIAGMILSITANATYTYLITLMTYEADFNPALFKLVSLCFFIQYTLVNSLLFIYVDWLSSKRRSQPARTVTMAVVFFAVCLASYIYFLFTRDMYYVKDGLVRFTDLFNVYILFGIFNAIMCLMSSISNRDTAARVAVRYVCIIIPFVIIIFIAQIFCQIAKFSSLTYILPFMLFYLLFHSNPFDEVSGCQNRHSFETRFVDDTFLHRRFLIVNIIFPRLKSAEQSYIKDRFSLISAEKCRQIATLHRGTHLYAFNFYNYAVYINVRDKEQKQKIIEEIRDILEPASAILMDSSMLSYKMIAFENSPHVDNIAKLSAMIKYLFAKLGNDSSSEMYIAEDKDYDEFALQYRIIQHLDDIKNNMNLDDERVLCFAQPIYSVASNSFRTAEALMRLKLDDTIIYPDKFIPPAEQNGSIHALTCIILNKVCREISRLNPDYDYDAITINCSTMEFSDKNLHFELLNIIRSNNIPCSKIRLELTESAMYDDFNIVLHNIERLRESGVQFYLDDFGTGYSNLERIISCPFNTIKFDKSLLYKSMKNAGVDDLLVSMVGVFKKQGFVLLVEGVEDDEQNQYSIDRGFSYIQGYKYAKPVPIAELSNYFTAKTM